MQRSDLLHCTDMPLPRFKMLAHREQLPFIVARDGEVNRHANYSLEDALRLRVQLDLIGASVKENELLSGLGPSTAARIVWNAMGVTPDPFAEPLEDWWLGVIVFRETDSSCEALEFTRWYSAPLAVLHREIARIIEKEAPQGGTIEAVRVDLVNVARAADFVLRRALRRGVVEANAYRRKS